MRANAGRSVLAPAIFPTGFSSAIARDPDVRLRSVFQPLNPPTVTSVRVRGKPPRTRSYVFHRCGLNQKSIAAVPPSRSRRVTRTRTRLQIPVDAVKLQAFIDMVDDLMLGDSGISKLEREMIAVVVSAVNHCHYCLTAHGAAVRFRSRDPELGELMVQNYRAARLEPRQKAMLDFAIKLTESPDKIEEADRQALRDAGFTDRDIWDIAAVAGFFNMSNRLAAASDMRPNMEYHDMARERVSNA